MQRTARLKLIPLLALLVPLFGSGSALAAETFEENLTAPGAITLDVSTGSGSIDITSGPGRDITVIGKVKVQKYGMIMRRTPDNADEIVQAILDNPPVELEGDVLVVGHIKDRAIRQVVSISYEIVVPADTRVLANSGSGTVMILDIDAPSQAGTGSGSIKLKNIGGDATAKTGSGTITADSIAGAFEGRTGSGSIRFSQVAPGDVVVSSGSGSIKLKGVVGALRAGTGSGSIEVDGQQAGDWKLNSGSGSITVRLPDDASFDLNAESNSGGVRVAEHFSVEGKVSRKHVKGAVNGGGPELRIDTGSGSIRVL
jgi:DUF4097 and DUF4098 domain-containing protein YvlB